MFFAREDARARCGALKPRTESLRISELGRRRRESNPRPRSASPRNERSLRSKPLSRGCPGRGDLDLPPFQPEATLTDPSLEFAPIDQRIRDPKHRAYVAHVLLRATFAEELELVRDRGLGRRQLNLDRVDRVRTRALERPRRATVISSGDVEVCLHSLAALISAPPGRRSAKPRHPRRCFARARGCRWTSPESASMGFPS